jgi:hypothetical protein
MPPTPTRKKNEKTDEEDEDDDSKSNIKKPNISDQDSTGQRSGSFTSTKHMADPLQHHKHNKWKQETKSKPPKQKTLKQSALEAPVMSEQMSPVPCKHIQHTISITAADSTKPLQDFYSQPHTILKRIKVTLRKDVGIAPRDEEQQHRTCMVMTHQSVYHWRAREWLKWLKKAALTIDGGYHGRWQVFRQTMTDPFLKVIGSVQLKT